MINVLMAICVIVLVFLAYFLYRSTKVYYFRIEIINRNSKVISSFLNSLKGDNEFKERFDQYLQLEDIKGRILNKHSYDTMLYSFKPLTLEYWFSKEEIEFMNLRYVPLK